MLVALVGLACAGKSSVANYLIDKHDFTQITLAPKSPGVLHFDSPEAMLHHVTAHWRTNYVTLDLDTTELVGMFDKRPFFLLVGIEAPMMLRWTRAKARLDASASDARDTLDLASFVAHDDSVMYGTTHTSDADAQHLSKDVSNLSFLHQSGSLISASMPSGNGALAALLSRSQLRIANTMRTLPELYAHLDTLSLTSMHRLRPTWDAYFVSLCSLASLRSNCMKRRVGAVIVRKNRVLSTGYNGTPRGLTNCNEGGCARCNESASCGSNLDECLCLHAEENALLELGRDRGGAEGTIIYCNTYVFD
ncbi:hypothetical protein CBS9595_001616 [Malassezia furfur]|nr:hypothetical protein CBS9595_001616 [Malassezia furfur]